MIGPPGGGSADAKSPRVDYNGHVLMDLAPYVLCCTGNAANCEAYYSERPSGTEENYRLPIPGDWTGNHIFIDYYWKLNFSPHFQN